MPPFSNHFYTMEDAGGRLTEIEKKLNRRDADTTSIYLERKLCARATCADTVAGILGIK